MLWQIRLFCVWSVCILSVSPLPAGWKAGVSRTIMTPETFMPMAGYASRGREPAHGKFTELWAKACVLEDEAGARAVLVTLDLIGIERSLSERICQRLQAECQLSRAAIAINASHTHTGPVVLGNLRPMYATLLNADEQVLVAEYADHLEHEVVRIVQAAVADLAPAEITWGQGIATFAVNRRNNSEAEVPDLRAAGQLKGPVDHAVPVLSITRAGKLDAVFFGYACHNTTLDSFEWSGDYAGYAQIAIEARFPGCTAMYWAGCGADQNPVPRRTVELAQQYGAELGAAVSACLAGRMQPLSPQLVTQYGEVALPFDSLPSRETLEQDAKSTNVYSAARAQALLGELQAGRELSPTYPYPVGTWRLGNQVAWVFLGGEVVVDYAVRLKQEQGDETLAGQNIWVAGYSNDVMAYIPSRRVLTEGGYEGGGAMVYYGLPATWAPDVEELIVREVQRQLTGKPE